MLPAIKKPINTDLKQTPTKTQHQIDNENENENEEAIEESIGDLLNSKYKSKKIWLDEKPPESMEKDIYYSIEFRLSEIEKLINKFDQDFGIDGQNIFHFLRNTSFNLNRLRLSVGLHEIKSAKTIRDAIKIIKFNLNLVMKMEQEKQEAQNKKEEQEEKELMKFVEENCIDESTLKLPDTTQKDETESVVSSENPLLANQDQINSENKQEEQLNNFSQTQPISIEKITNETKNIKAQEEKEVEIPKVIEEQVEEDDEEELERKRKEKLKKKEIGINISQSLRYVTKKKKPQVEIDIDQITSDEIITPLLKAAKRNFIPVNKETEFDSNVLENVFNKTIDLLKDYSYLIENIEIINNTCDKYFCSFIEESYASFQEDMAIGLSEKNFSQSKALLDSALKYQDRRKKYFKQIKKNLKNLRILVEKFDDGTYDGIEMEDFSDETRKLSDRYDCDLIQSVLIIPDHSLLLRSCIHTLREWIDYDKSYSDYILSDMKETDRKKKNLNSIRHTCELMNNQLIYRIRILKQTMDQLSEDMNDTLKKKYSQYEEFDEDLDVNFIANKSKLNKYKLLRYAPMDCKLMLDTISSELDHIEGEINKEVNFIKTLPTNHKLNQFDIDEKFKHVDKIKRKIFEIEDYLIYLYNEKKIKQNELDVLENCYVKLKEIHINKISTETLEKIFYGLSLPTFKLVSNNNNNNRVTDQNQITEKNIHKDSTAALASLVFNNSYDPFEVYFSVISRKLLNEWIKLYYLLPFYPERGIENKKKDIDHVRLRASRTNSSQEQCFYLLRLWKRRHTRAKLDNLDEALKKLGRSDILKEIENEMKQMDEKFIGRKRRDSTEIDIRKREAEALHQKLVKFFERRNANNYESGEEEFKKFVKMKNRRKYRKISKLKPIYTR